MVKVPKILVGVECNTWMLSYVDDVVDADVHDSVKNDYYGEDFVAAVAS
jgi:hypothetical protein